MQKCHENNIQESETQNINLLIHATRINVTVPKDQEESWRKAAQLVNMKLNTYMGQLKDKRSEPEIGYYAMLDLALMCVAQAQRNDVSPVMDILNKLSSEIEQAMK